MAKEEKKEERFIYKMSTELSKTGFAVFELAKNVEQELQKRYPEPEFRVRNRLRRRTETWDVVVKVRVPAPKAEAKPAVTP